MWFSYSRRMYFMPLWYSFYALKYGVKSICISLSIYSVEIIQYSQRYAWNTNINKTTKEQEIKQKLLKHFRVLTTFSEAGFLFLRMWSEAVLIKYVIYIVLPPIEKGSRTRISTMKRRKFNIKFKFKFKIYWNKKFFTQYINNIKYREKNIKSNT